MFGPKVEEEFLNDPTAARLQGREGLSWSLLLLIMAGLGGFLAWAATFEIEEITRGQGRVVPSAQIQIVQSLEAGIVQDILVAEGEAVVEGQPLLLIDDTAAAANLGELREQEAALMVEALRLEAEATLTRVPEFPVALQTRAPQAVLAELDVLASRFDQLDNELNVLNDQLSQKRASLGELQASREKQLSVQAPLEEELTLTEKLAESGAVPQIDLLRLRARVAEVRGDIAVSVAQEPNLRALISETESQIAVARSTFTLAARQRLARLQVELAVVREALRAAQDRVTRRQLLSPIDGTINAVRVSTLGEVVEPGAALIEVVPALGGLEVEAEIFPRDVAFIAPGDPVSVKITAYDYLVYGALEGTVARIGADTILKPDGQEYFKLIVQTEQTDLGPGLPIRPGMTASVDIQTGQRSVLSYLAQPLLRLRSEALRDG